MKIHDWIIVIISWVFLLSVGSLVFERKLSAVIVCSESIDFGEKKVWIFKIPNKEGDCPDNATHWKIYADRISN